jgi:hypothetical protein
MWNDQTASTDLGVVFLKRYSSAPTGRPESSAWPGMNGLQALRLHSIGTAESFSVTSAKGNRAVNFAESKRGRPKELMPVPMPE